MHCRPRAEAHVAVGPLAPAQRPAEHGGAVGDEALVVVVVVVGLAGADDGRQETRRGVARPAVVERLRGGVARAAPRQRPGARRVAGEGRGESQRARARRRGLHERRERLEAAARAQLQSHAQTRSRCALAGDGEKRAGVVVGEERVAG